MDLLNVERLVEDFKAGQVTQLEELRMQLEMSIRGVEFQLPGGGITRETNKPEIRVLNSHNFSTKN